MIRMVIWMDEGMSLERILLEWVGWLGLRVLVLNFCRG